MHVYISMFTYIYIYNLNYYGMVERTRTLVLAITHLVPNPGFTTDKLCDLRVNCLISLNFGLVHYKMVMLIPTL